MQPSLVVLQEGDPVEVDFLGGDLFCSLLAQLRFRLPIPAMDAAGMYGHLFANGANSVLLTGSARRLGDGGSAAAAAAAVAVRTTIEEGLQDFKRSWRWSAVRTARHTMWLLSCHCYHTSDTCCIIDRACIQHLHCIDMSASSVFYANVHRDPNSRKLVFCPVISHLAVKNAQGVLWSRSDHYFLWYITTCNDGCSATSSSAS